LIKFRKPSICHQFRLSMNTSWKFNCIWPIDNKQQVSCKLCLNELLWRFTKYLVTFDEIKRNQTTLSLSTLQYDAMLTSLLYRITHKLNNYIGSLIMNTESAATALGALRTRSFLNAATNIQSASPGDFISSPVTRMLPVVPNRSGNTNQAVKGTWTCPISGQLSRFTHPMVLFINIAHVLQSVQDLINCPVICTLHQLSISQLMYSQLMGWAQSPWINFRIVAIT